MRYGRKISPAEVDFWLDTNQYSNFIEERIDTSNQTLVFNIDMVRLASIRSSIANFVRILTRKPIPVYFSDMNDSINYDGKAIYISAKINTKQDFDVAVGLALHEGSHTLYTDFDLIKNAWANIPHHILTLSDSKNIRRSSLEKFIHNMWNVIEDRYIDNYVFNEAPGYRGYYVALYDKYFNSPDVDEYLKSDNFRYPSLKSYDFRISNFTNENTDLLALPCLEDIAKAIDISHIDRLTTTKDRINIAFKVTDIVLNCIDKQDNLKKFEGNKKNIKKYPDLADPRDYFDFGDDYSDDTSNDNSDNEEVDVGKKMIKEISDIVNGREEDLDKLSESKNIVDKISENELTKEEEREINKIIEKQHKFLSGNISKEEVNEFQKELLNLIEKHGIVLVRVDLPTVVSGNDVSLKVDCIVVQKMTKELIISGKDVFPLCGAMKIGQDDPEPPNEVLESVKKGMILGRKLGRRLQIRAESHPIKKIRKRSGKINKRQLHEAAFDAEDLFYKMYIEKHHNANLHISVDASGSMNGNKWEKTMIAVVAICKAASMVDNIHVSVSFRTTQVSGKTQLPYVVLAYDSNIDKISKVRNLFPYLEPEGCTPEGLAFGSIMNLFESITPDEEDRFFLNLSDGEPYYILNVPDTGVIIKYKDDIGTSHTKSQVDKIRRHGVQILSYFIDDNLFLGMDKKDINSMTTDEIEQIENNPLRKNFRKMYGKNAKFIRVDEITDLAKTLNELFLKKDEK